MVLVRTNEKPPEGSCARVMEKAWLDIVRNGNKAVAAEVAQMLKDKEGYVIIDPESDQYPSRLLAAGQTLLRPADLAFRSPYGKLSVVGARGELLLFEASQRAVVKVMEASENPSEWTALNQLIVKLMFGERVEIVFSEPAGFSVEYQDLLRDVDIALPGFPVHNSGQYRVQQIGFWSTRLAAGISTPAQSLLSLRRLELIGTPLRVDE